MVRVGLVVGHGHIGGAEVDFVTHEALHPGAGSDRLVGDLHPTTPAATPKVGQPPGVQGGGKGRPGADELRAPARVGTAAVAASGRATGGEQCAAEQQHDRMPQIATRCS